MKQKKRNWLARHSKEVLLRRSLGQSFSQIAQAFDWNEETVRSRAYRDRLSRPLSASERQQLVNEIDRDKTIERLLDEVPGSLAHMRLRRCLTGLIDMSKTKASETTRRKPIKEMSDDELRAYVASVVPGLDVDFEQGAEPGTAGSDRAISVSGDGAGGAEATAGE